MRHHVFSGNITHAEVNSHKQITCKPSKLIKVISTNNLSAAQIHSKQLPNKRKRSVISIELI